MKHGLRLLTATLLLASCHPANEPSWPTPPGDQAGNTCDCNQSWCYASCCIDHCTASMASIDSARSSIRVATSTPLSPSVIAALANARQRGVEVRALVTPALAPSTSELAANGIPVKAATALPANNILIVDDMLVDPAHQMMASAIAPARAGGNKQYSLRGIMTHGEASRTLDALSAWESLWQKSQ